MLRQMDEPSIIDFLFLSALWSSFSEFAPKGKEKNINNMKKKNCLGEFIPQKLHFFAFLLLCFFHGSAREEEEEEEKKKEDE